MTRDEYYSSTKFKSMRLVNNMAHEFSHLAQRLYDALEIAVEYNPELNLMDKAAIFERQLRLISSESRRLIEYCTEMDVVLRKKISDSNSAPTTPDDSSNRPT
jgi:hypothetical protein